MTDSTHPPALPAEREGSESPSVVSGQDIECMSCPLTLSVGLVHSCRGQALAGGLAASLDTSARGEQPRGLSVNGTAGLLRLSEQARVHAYGHVPVQRGARPGVEAVGDGVELVLAVA